MQLQLFEVEDYNSVFHNLFLESDLGQIYSAIPFSSLAQFFKSKFKKSNCGVPATFSIEGGLGLMFLKHLSNLSDAKLIERVNTDWIYQKFCGLPPQIHCRIKDKDIVGRWRRFFGKYMNIKELQSILIQEWKPDLAHTQLSMNDATVYESYIKYPTDTKLLWDCTAWVHRQIVKISRFCNVPIPRSKYKDQKKKHISFCKQRKKSKKLERKRRESLLYLLNKLVGQLQGLLTLGGRSLIEQIDPKIFSNLKIVRTVLFQQNYHFNHPEKPVPNRIVSFYKPYLRPIVRGKENKPVEFGAKVHQMQVGGCNFIEHLDFEAFHEGNRMKKAILQHNQWFGKVRQYAADAIYATNRNRKWCKKNEIATCFVPKGREGKSKDQAKALRTALGAIRATALEGSFGNEKNHYLLRKVKARTQQTEVVWIFFGVHCANAVKVAKARSAITTANGSVAA